MAERPINIVQLHNDYKVQDSRFHTRVRSANNKTYSCGVVKSTTAADSGRVDFYGVLEEVIKVECLGEPIKRCVLFRCDWFDPLKPPRNTV